MRSFAHRRGGAHVISYAYPRDAAPLGKRRSALGREAEGEACIDGAQVSHLRALDGIWSVLIEDRGNAAVGCMADRARDRDPRPGLNAAGERDGSTGRIRVKIRNLLADTRRRRKALLGWLHEA